MQISKKVFRYALHGGWGIAHLLQFVTKRRRGFKSFQILCYVIKERSFRFFASAAKTNHYSVKFKLWNIQKWIITGSSTMGILWKKYFHGFIENFHFFTVAQL
uniref:(northern house mosquito) hypothetical protein n=1 Tax=Culex pipiens TaxID=7175 RepID=A0A8D8GX52_CULPI